jgi:cytochrome c peroxidase
MRLRHAYPEQVERLFGPVPPPLERALARSEPADAAEAAAIWATLTPAAQRQCDALFAGAGKVIAAYQRHLAPRPAPFDAYAAALRAGDPQGGGLLSEAAVRGLRAFVGEAGCVNCHNGPLFTDFAFHNLGLVEAPGLDEPDPGRARGIRQLLDDPFRSDGAFSDARSNPELDYLNANFEDALGAFKTPSLRNVAQTAPYGHAGQFTSLVEVLEFYRRGGGEPAIGHADPLLGQIGAEFSVTDGIAYLESLTGPPPPAPWGTPPEGAADG